LPSITRTGAERAAGVTQSPRPRLIALNACHHGQVQGLTLRNSPSFHLVLRSCADDDNIAIRETNGGVQDVLVADCIFHDTDNGVRIKTNRQVGGPITRLAYANLTMQGVKQPIALYQPLSPDPRCGRSAAAVRRDTGCLGRGGARSGR
jgi:polygalacturonase